LVELEIDVGRPAQLRAQLAAAGAPIAGDRERNGPAARRLMLHASVVGFEDETGPREYRSESPEELSSWLAEAGDPWPHTTQALSARLRASAALRWGLATSARGDARTTAFRMVDGVGDGIAGLAVDLYGEHLVAHVYPDLLPIPEERVLDALAGLGAAGVYVKRRPVQANELVDTRRDEIAPSRAVRGEDAPDELVVFEEGIPYIARLGDGLSTGLFLDQRDNRSRVRGWASGNTMLNLFAYTCPFTVAAAAGGASRTLSIDASARALEMGRANVENASDGGQHEFVKADVFDALDDLARRGERFDLVVVDPPTYSTTRGSRWTSGKAWVDLATRALGVVEKHGRVLCSSNDRRLSERKFERYLRAALRADGRRGRVETHPPPADFPPPPGGEAHLKTGVIELR
jgi:23S rRNA (cytosine1962-C5)-methyltransferase